VGWDISVGIATRYGRNGPGIETPCGVRFSATLQTGPVGHAALLYNGYGDFSGVKEAEASSPPTQSSAQVAFVASSLPLPFIKLYFPTFYLGSIDGNSVVHSWDALVATLNKMYFV